MPPYPTTRAQISRSRLVGNFERLRALAQSTPGADACELLAVVKANAYGHGLSLCAQVLMRAGAEWLGVTSAKEGVLVRGLCPQARILVMRGLLAGEADMVLDANLVPTIWDRQHLRLLAETARARKFMAGQITAHLEVDTGMSRQGIAWSCADIATFLDDVRSVPALRIDGIYTHFASPEMLDCEQNAQQMNRFEQVVEQIAAAGIRPGWLHAGNSSCVLSQQLAAPLASLAAKIHARYMIRPGIALYGYACPFTGEQTNNAENLRNALQPVLAWKTAIASLRIVEAGTCVGYDATFIATKKMRLALLPVGYADGLNRKLSNRGHVLVRGVAAPIIGRVSMDLTVIDVSDVSEAIIGDEVVLLGEQGTLRVTADDHARWAQTIPYEVLCAIGARVPRVRIE